MRRAQPAFRRAVTVAVACALAAGAVTAVSFVHPDDDAQASTAGLKVVQKWSVNFGVKGRPVALASPMVATLDAKGSSVLIGDRAGYERAFHLTNGSRVAGWPVSTGGVAVDSTPSVLNSGTATRTFWGEGTSSSPSRGGYRSLAANGKVLWSTKVKAAPTGSAYRGVMSSITLGKFRSSYDAIGGSMGQLQNLMYASTGRVETGFPWFQADSNFSTPALAQISGSRPSIVEGGDSTAGVAFGVHYSNGGHIRVLNATGNAGTGAPGGGLRCQYNTTQVVQSSPAVGKFLINGATGIVVGTGEYWARASDTNKVIAVDTSCHLRWSRTLAGVTSSSPALSNLRGGGHLFVVQGTREAGNKGHVYALDGVNGKPIWSVAVPGAVYGGITTADLSGKGYQDVLVPTTTGTYVYDGRTGKLLTRIGAGYGFQNSALVTNDPDGTVGITLAGYDGQNRGVLLHYSIPGSKGSRVNVSGAWPMFHHDQQLTGNAATKLPAKP